MSVRVGLVGAGRMGRILAHHLAFSVQAADFVAIADSNPGKAEALAAACGHPRVYPDFQEMLAGAHLDAVVIATPSNSHVDLILAAARAGVHVFCEKPLALTVEGCDRAVAAARSAGVALMVGFMRRFDPAYVAARRQISAGTIGRPVMFKAVGRDPWRTGLEFARRENSGGLIADMAIHDFDLARWLMGSEVERVQAEGSCLVFPELATVGDIDNAVINLRFANGAVGNVDVSRNALYGYDVRSEIIGSEGSLFIGGLPGTGLLLKKNGLSHDAIPCFEARFAQAYAAEIEEFVQAVAQGRQVAVGGAEGRAATAIAVAATRSLDEGRVVALAEVAGTEKAGIG